MKDSITTGGLPVNLDDLLHSRTIESNRIEFKGNWSDPIKAATVRTIGAFANDLLNLNGGYVVLGIRTEEGRPMLPPMGLDSLSVDRVQREIRGACKNLRPEYQPILFPAYYQEKLILVMWCPGGDNRPYQAPDDINQKGSQFNCYVRQGAETVKAQGEVLRQLMELAAKVPFDDRRSLNASLEDLSPTLVRRFLHDIRSDLVATPQVDDAEMYRRLRIVVPVNGYEVPKNVGTLFFNEDPERFFPGARVDVVQFGDDAGGDLIEEKIFRGPLPQQIRNVLEYLSSFGGTLLQKVPGQPEVERTVAYPYEAMREAVVNALYHRGYEGSTEPVKIYLYPDRMEITSYPGPAPGIEHRHFEPGSTVPAVPARNRRIGEFLKELHLAESRGTGIPKIRRRMSENGSPEARFNFDDARTYFQVVLPVHPRYQVIYALRESAHFWAVGEKPAAIDHLRRAFERQPSSGAIATQIIEYGFATGDIALARSVMAEFEKQDHRSEVTQPFLVMARLLLDKNLPSEANGILTKMPKSQAVDDLLEAGILKKRSGDLEGAHHQLTEAYALSPDNAKIVQELAQTKLKLAKGLYKSADRASKRRLNQEAAELLRRAIQLSEDRVRVAWCWYDLARTLDWLRAPTSEVEEAFLNARTLLPNEAVFMEGYQRWKRAAGGARH